MRLRDKKVVSVFVRFRAPLHFAYHPLIKSISFRFIGVIDIPLQKRSIQHQQFSNEFGGSLIRKDSYDVQNKTERSIINLFGFSLE
jgi:hypothetical protein